MALEAIAYASKATKRLTVAELNDLVQRAYAVNMVAGVTGLLLYDGARFLQYFEGPDDRMATVYARILSSALHSDVIELARGRVGRRRMPYWSMRWVLADMYKFNEAAFSDWSSFVRHSGENHRVPSGVDRLHALAAPYLE